MYMMFDSGNRGRRPRECRMKSVVMAALFLVTFALPALADYEAGRKAWNAGKSSEALAQWRAAADGGDRRAMLELGRLYVRGLGVPQSFVQAHVWFNLAASRGVEAAVKERDAVAAKMTPQQLATAQERALSWRPAAGSGTSAGAPPPRAEDLERRNWPAGESFRDCRGCPEMVVVPAGEYMMGVPDDEKDEGFPSAKPRHQVTIRRRFAVGKYEVTRGEYERFMKESGRLTADGCFTYEGKWKKRWKNRGGRDWSNPGFSQGEREPVVCVNWDEAQAYVEWLSRKTGERYRLLTESEWEYATRGGTKGRYHFGERISKSLANFYGSRGETTQVGSYPANDFGLHDVHGNVSEWVEDCWHENYSGAPTDGSAWTIGGNCEVRVLRGGAWGRDGPSTLRSASRDRNWARARSSVRGFPWSRSSEVGFRVARTLAP